MDTSFYSAVRGAMTQQKHMDILANNLANVNTNAYKSKSASFQDLMYANMKDRQETDSRIQTGSGTIISQTNTDFRTGNLIKTARNFDFAIDGTAFFRLQDSVDGSVSYTRDGAFLITEKADGMYLTDEQGRYVLDNQRNPIRYENGELTQLPGMFEFVHTHGMQSVGENGFEPIPQNGADVVSAESDLLIGYLEGSNVDLADQMSKIIQSSKAYSYMLKMVQTADEIEQTINGLRG